MKVKKNKSKHESSCGTGDATYEEGELMIGLRGKKYFLKIFLWPIGDQANPTFYETNLVFILLKTGDLLKVPTDGPFN